VSRPRPERARPLPEEPKEDLAEDLAFDELDDADHLPELDGELDDGASADEDVAPDDAVADETVGLDDEVAAEEAAEAIIDTIADVEAEGWETADGDPLEADDELAEGESEDWTDGSEEDRDAPLELEGTGEPDGIADLGEEGPDEPEAELEELELPPSPRLDEVEDYADDLDVGADLPPRRDERVEDRREE